MHAEFPLCRAAGLDPGPELEARLAEALASARTAWPSVNVDAAVFLAYFGERAREEGTGAETRLLPSDLYVACACVERDGRAVAALEARYFPEVKAALAKMNLGGARVEDVMQIVRRQLFTAEPGKRPRIVEYTGRGALGGWLRVTAVRAALKVLRKEKPAAHVQDDALLEARTTGADPELLYVKEVYRAELKAAFQGALDALEDREKNVLRQNVVDGLSIDEIGALYGVHRATAARWLTKAKEQLLARTRQGFMERVRMSARECESVLRLVQSQLDATIRRRLEAAGEGDPPR